MMVCMQHLYYQFCIIILSLSTGILRSGRKINSKRLCKNCCEKSDGSQTLTAEKIAFEISENCKNVYDYQQLVTVENCTLTEEKISTTIICVETNEVCLNIFQDKSSSGKISCMIFYL